MTSGLWIKQLLGAVRRQGLVHSHRAYRDDWVHFAYQQNIRVAVLTLTRLRGSQLKALKLVH